MKLCLLLLSLISPLVVTAASLVSGNAPSSPSAPRIVTGQERAAEAVMNRGGWNYRHHQAGHWRSCMLRR